jgi:RNA polymerase-binding transcription factor DksA
VALTSQQIADFKKQLIERITALYRSTHADLRDETEREGPSPWAQDDRPRDEGDEALYAQLSDTAHSLDERHAALALAMEAALGRIRDGTFGTCAACGRDIELDRLRVVPWATLCIEDQEALEQEQQARPPTL